MILDAVILAGGKATRLGGVPKHSLRLGGRSLLDLAVAAAEGARAIVVVGDIVVAPPLLVARETPPFAGPVAALDAGMDALDAARVAPDPESQFTLVLACDVPASGEAVRALREVVATDADRADGALAVDAAGRDQYLLAIYSTHSLRRVLGTIDVQNASMRAIVGRLDLLRVSVPAGSTDDIDTWAEAERLGVTRPRKDPR